MKEEIGYEFDLLLLDEAYGWVKKLLNFENLLGVSSPFP